MSDKFETVYSPSYATEPFTDGFPAADPAPAGTTIEINGREYPAGPDGTFLVIKHDTDTQSPA